MERPHPETIAAYEAALPSDPRVARGQMFAHPCAFVNGHMFFGTFAQTLIARVGSARVAPLLATGARTFEPIEGRAWAEYVQVDADDPRAGDLAREALEATARLPPKAKKPAKPREPR